MPTAGAAIEPYGATLNPTETAKGKALEQNVTGWARARIIPDNAHRPCLVAHGDTWKVVHWEAVIAWNERGIHRPDINSVCIGWTTTG